MRTLKFIVTDQLIKLDPLCETDELVPGTESYITAEFTFSREWAGYTAVASFRSMLGREYEPQRLIDGKYCLIPSEALRKRSFKVQVIGKKGDSRLTTNRVIVTQNGGRA